MVNSLSEGFSQTGCSLIPVVATYAPAEKLDPGKCCLGFYLGFMMQEVQERWKADYTMWMNPNSKREYERLWCSWKKGDRQKVHQYVRSRLNTYLFQLCGCKHLVQILVMHPVCSRSLPIQVVEESSAASPAHPVQRFISYSGVLMSTNSCVSRVRKIRASS